MKTVPDTEEASKANKPPHKAPCNGCGWCCISEVCRIGLTVNGEDTQAPCPSIVMVEGVHRCGVVLDEIDAGGRMVQDMLGTDTYCDSQTVEEMLDELSDKIGNTDNGVGVRSAS